LNNAFAIAVIDGAGWNIAASAPAARNDKRPLNTPLNLPSSVVPTLIRQILCTARSFTLERAPYRAQRGKN